MKPIKCLLREGCYYHNGFGDMIGPMKLITLSVTMPFAVWTDCDGPYFGGPDSIPQDRQYWPDGRWASTRRKNKRDLDINSESIKLS